MIETQFPLVEFGWTAAQIRFLAQGPEPFTLQTGARNETQQPGPTGILLNRSTRYETVALLASNDVPVITVQVDKAVSQSDETSATGLLDKQFLIWMILIAGVLVMAYMAWQLLRSIESKKEEDS